MQKGGLFILADRLSGQTGRHMRHWDESHKLSATHDKTRKIYGTKMLVNGGINLVGYGRHFVIITVLRPITKQTKSFKSLSRRNQAILKRKRRLIFALYSLHCSTIGRLTNPCGALQDGRK